MTERLIPPGLDVNEVPTPLDCYESCAHADACVAQLERLRGRLADGETYSITHLVCDLGCGEDCDAYDENEQGDLRHMCRRLLGMVGTDAVDPALGRRLRRLGIMR